jgi:hypothetical protein
LVKKENKIMKTFLKIRKQWNIKIFWKKGNNEISKSSGKKERKRREKDVRMRVRGIVLMSSFNFVLFWHPMRAWVRPG